MAISRADLISSIGSRLCLRIARQGSIGQRRIISKICSNASRKQSTSEQRACR